MTGSVVVPAKAIVMNVLSLGATFGALVWVFQDGHLSGEPDGQLELVGPRPAGPAARAVRVPRGTGPGPDPRLNRTGRHRRGGQSRGTARSRPTAAAKAPARSR